jgi:hypothetical protein
VETIVVVIRPFGRHGVGEMIRDPDSVREILNGEHAQDVVRVVGAHVDAQKEG